MTISISQMYYNEAMKQQIEMMNREQYETANTNPRLQAKYIGQCNSLSQIQANNAIPMAIQQAQEPPLNETLLLLEDV